MKLKRAGQLLATPTPPFHFDSTFHKPDHFPSCDNAWEPGASWQTWRWQEKELGLLFVNKGSLKSPRIMIEIWARSNLANDLLDSLAQEITYRFNLDLDLTDFYLTCGKDKLLGPSIRRWRGMRPGHQNSLYEYLMIGIVLQNATVRRSIQMLDNLLKRFGTTLVFDHKELWCFWNPGDLKEISEQNLRDLKLGYRAKSIKRIDEQFQRHNIDEIELRKKDRQTQREALMKLYGIGPATVGYLLFDVFHHYDFVEHISPWEQKIYCKLFFGSEPEKPLPVEKLLRAFDRYGKYKQLAVHYLWEDLWWKRKNRHIPWLEKMIRQ